MVRCTDRDRAVNPVIGTVLLIGVAVILSASIGTFLIGMANDLSGGAQGAVEVSHSVQDPDDGFITISSVSMQRADRITITATDVDGADRLEGGASVLADEIRTVGGSVTIRQDSDHEGDVDVSIVAIAEYGDDSALIFDREYRI
ncbi:type IV pilin [Halosolutus gelatinilyticus]|uniref:type IV pilin n=1 Tax=Halosolutus gelatinilyticus TaxID=2931975 RepID=UPI001FF2E3A1|nr:type IV pilin N-terminal domain-containing protein [Halosolutus gelatinilyticus]